MGALTFRVTGTLLEELVTEPIAGTGTVGTYDCPGFYGDTCGVPAPEWRHTARVTWASAVEHGPVARLALLRRGHRRHLEPGGVAARAIRRSPMRAASAQDYIDVAASWTFMEAYSVRLGINNVLDEDPPLGGQGSVPTAVGNGNTFPQVYDALGRYVFMGLTGEVLT